MPIGSSSPSVVALADVLASATAVLAETYPRGVIGGTNLETSGKLRGALVPLRAGMTVGAITCNVSTVGAGMTLWQHAIYDANGNLLRNSANTPASVQALGNVTLSLTTPLLITATAAYYLCYLGVTGTTMPTLATDVSPTSFIGPFNAIGSGKPLATSQNGLAALPDPTVIAATGVVPYLAAS